MTLQWFFTLEMKEQPLDVLIVLGVACLIFFSMCSCFARICYVRIQTARQRNNIAKQERLLVNNGNNNGDDLDMKDDGYDAMQRMFRRQHLKHIEDKHKCEGKQNIDPEEVSINKSTINIDKQGWIMMKFKKSMSYKKRYYFMFSGDRQQLWYYNNKTDSCSKGIIEWKHVINIEKIEDDDEQKDAHDEHIKLNQFRITQSEQEWYFHFETVQDRDDWYNILNSYCLTEQDLVLTSNIEGYGGQKEAEHLDDEMNVVYLSDHEEFVHRENEEEIITIEEETVEIAPVAFLDEEDLNGNDLSE